MASLPMRQPKFCPKYCQRGQQRKRGTKITAQGERLKLHGHSADTRHNDTLSQEVSYASWTQNRSLNSSHPCPTPDAPGVAAGNGHTGWPRQAWPDVVTPG